MPTDGEILELFEPGARVMLFRGQLLAGPYPRWPEFHQIDVELGHFDPAPARAALWLEGQNGLTVAFAVARSFNFPPRSLLMLILATDPAAGKGFWEVGVNSFQYPALGIEFTLNPDTYRCLERVEE